MRIVENQFGFMSGKSITKAIYLLSGSMERYQSKERDFHMVFIDLEKSLWSSTKGCVLEDFLRKRKGVHVAYIQEIREV